VELLSAYPALVVGTVVGYIASRLERRLMPIAAVGAVALVALAVYQSTVPFHPGEPWSGTMTAPLWVVLTAVNVGSWLLGIVIGVAVCPRLARSAS
jgi:fructose-specific phosphotransferase system IIC component